MFIHRILSGSKIHYTQHINSYIYTDFSYEMNINFRKREKKTFLKAVQPTEVYQKRYSHLLHSDERRKMQATTNIIK